MPSTRRTAGLAANTDTSGHGNFAETLKTLGRKRKTTPLSPEEEAEFLEAALQLQADKEKDTDTPGGGDDGNADTESGDTAEAGPSGSGKGKTNANGKGGQPKSKKRRHDISPSSSDQEEGASSADEDEAEEAEDDPDEEQYFALMIEKHLKSYLEKNTPVTPAASSTVGNSSQAAAAITGESDTVVVPDTDVAPDPMATTLAKFFKKPDTFSADLAPAILDSLKSALHEEVPQEDINQLEARNLMPQNAKEIVVAEIDKGVWEHLPRNPKQVDYSIQYCQGYMLKALIPLVRELHHRLETDKDEASLQRLTDAMKFLGLGFRFAYNERKRHLKPLIDNDYKALCSPKIPVTGAWLLGDNLSKTVTDLEATHKVGKMVQAKRKFFDKPKVKKQKFKKRFGDKSFFKKRVAFLAKDNQSGSDHQSQPQQQTKAPGTFPKKK